MNAISRAINICAGVGIWSTLFVSQALAGCGDPSNLQSSLAFAPPLAVQLRTAYMQPEISAERATSEVSIVGMWSFQFIAKGNTNHNPALPDGAIVDFGYTQWHSDGTEITNSGGRSPAVENFCLGVWGRTGFNAYELNHFAFNYDAATGKMTGLLQVREQVTLSPSGNSFSGTFTIDVFDTNQKQIDHVIGNIVGTRVTVDTTVP